MDVSVVSQFIGEETKAQEGPESAQDPSASPGPAAPSTELPQSSGLPPRTLVPGCLSASSSATLPLHCLDNFLTCSSTGTS